MLRNIQLKKKKNTKTPLRPLFICNDKNLNTQKDKKQAKLQIITYTFNETEN